MASLPMVGDELAGYRLQGVLGRGGMSVVYEAENPRLGSAVALKVLAPELATNDSFRARFLKESRIAASLNHPNVIPIYDMGSHEDLLYIAMRHVAGADLRAVLKAQQVIASDQALLLLGQAGRALDAAHRHGLVHRDVKPGNILIERAAEEDEIDHVYLSDFGISKHAASNSGLTATGEFMGTIDYIAPEQIKGQLVDGRADIYSLGCVMYECLTGQVPFAKDVDAAVIWAHVEETPIPPCTLRAGLPPAIDEVMSKALAKDPAVRYSTCREFITAARAALTIPAAVPLHTATVLAATPVPTATPGYPRTAPGSPGIVPQPTPSAQPGAGGSFSSASPPEQPLGGPPPDGPPATPPARPRRRRLLAGLGALVLVIAAAGGWLIWHTSQSAPSAPTKSHMDMAMHSPLMTALTNANKATKLLPMKTCHPQSTTVVTCSQPYFAIQTVTFRTYPSRTALYNAYVADVRNLGDAKSNSIKINFGNCSKAVTTGEVSWNHNFEHPRIYSLAQSISGTLDPSTQAAGRAFCTINANGQYQLIWTENGGRLLASMNGGPHDSAWSWWQIIHHNIFLPGSPMMHM